MNAQIAPHLYRKSTHVTDARGCMREYYYDANGP